MPERGEGLQGGEEEILESEEVGLFEQTEIVDGIKLDGTEDIRTLAEKAYNSEKAKAINKPDGGEGEKDGEAEAKAQGVRPENQQQSDKNQEINAPNIQPPNRLSAQEKELFNKLPKRLKPTVARMFQEHEGAFTRAQTQWAQEIREVQSMREAVRPYYVSHPELAEAGYTESGFLAALVARHAKLSDPKTSYQDYIRLGRELGHIGEDGNVRTSGNNNFSGVDIANIDLSQHPQFLALQQSYNQLASSYEQGIQYQIEQSGAQIAEEMRSVMEEKDQFGRYLYPELHDENFFQATKPLVSQLAQTLPYGEALKRAYYAMTGNLPSTSQTRLPADNKALNAGASVRGRSGQQVAGGNSVPEDFSKMSIRDMAEWSAQQLARGV